MATKDDDKPSVYAGCATATVHLLVSGPIWFVLLYGILDRTDAPTWQWALYWVYVPASILAYMLMELARTLARSGK